MLHYLALLRGINVGGNNIIKMADLKACFEQMGFSDVKTYIQSGNVIFKSKEKNLEKLTRKIEACLSKTFNYPGRTVVISADMLKKVIAEVPKRFGSDKEKYRYDVIFLRAPMTPQEALKQVQTRDDVDQAHAGHHALYFSRLIAQATKSYLPKIIQLPVYQFMTIRNWNTTMKLWGLMS